MYPILTHLSSVPRFENQTIESLPLKGKSFHARVEFGASSLFSQRFHGFENQTIESSPLKAKSIYARMEFGSSSPSSQRSHGFENQTIVSSPLKAKSIHACVESGSSSSSSQRSHLLLFCLELCLSTQTAPQSRQKISRIVQRASTLLKHKSSCLQNAKHHDPKSCSSKNAKSTHNFSFQDSQSVAHNENPARVQQQSIVKVKNVYQSTLMPLNNYSSVVNLSRLRFLRRLQSLRGLYCNAEVT